MTGAERRYRWLLRAYPRAYRRYRADEMMETLLGTSETDRRHPDLRECLALVVGGLRVRSGVARLGSREALRSSALRLTALSLLVCGVALTALPLMWRLWLLLPGNSSGLEYGRSSLFTPAWLLLALVTAAWARYRLALVITLYALGAEVWHFGSDSVWYSAEYWTGFDAVPGLRTGMLLASQLSTWTCLLAVLTMVPLLRERHARVTRPWTWLVGAAVTIAVMAPNPFNGWDDHLTLPVILAVGLVAALVGAALDVRISIAASVVLSALILPMLAYHLSTQTLYDSYPAPRPLFLGAILVALAMNIAVSTVAARRQVSL
ncbi:hypothetical protein AB0J90_01950 [Micromonospora sp. NPDC049523]|uniref:hypothetical protein n=1 Tax=Micromonospora sp. NPDC049523 TaxID=3155921 RepID=UPI00341E83F3